MDISNLINTAQVARIFGVRSRNTISLWVRDKKLPEPKKLGNRFYWNKDEILSIASQWDDLYDTNTVMNMLPINNRGTLTAWCEKGYFPKPDTIGGRLYWNKDEVATWLKDKVA